MKPIPLEEASDESSYGGKCVSLGRALRAGLPTPAGFALSVAYVNHVVVSGLDQNPELTALFNALAPAMAVRSSAVGEDSEEASFAGQHATIMNVMSPTSMMAAIVEVHDSARTAEALAYRQKMGISEEAAIAIAVQKQIHSDISGVLFTRNPITGDEERVIEASWGLGEVIVAGLVVPDSFRLASNGQILERTAGEKDIKLVPDPQGNAVEVEVEAGLIETLCLADNQLLALHKLAADCESVYGEGLDIEWAIAEEQLFLLQCRAITR